MLSRFGDFLFGGVMAEKVPGYVGLCTQCRQVVRVSRVELGLSDNEQLVGYVCATCTQQVMKPKESDGPDTVLPEQGGPITC